MYRIIDTRGSGKTSRLMLIAKENDAYFVCRDVEKMRLKAYSYGLSGIDFISYEDCITSDDKYFKGHKVVIDDLEDFIQFLSNGVKVIGYTLSED